jgi:hypothetical protein
MPVSKGWSLEIELLNTNSGETTEKVKVIAEF